MAARCTGIAATANGRSVRASSGVLQPTGASVATNHRDTRGITSHRSLPTALCQHLLLKENSPENGITTTRDVSTAYVGHNYMNPILGSHCVFNSIDIVWHTFTGSVDTIAKPVASKLSCQNYAVDVHF